MMEGGEGAVFPLGFMEAGNGGENVRTAAVAGAFYPGTRAAIRQMVQRYLQKAEPAWDGPLRAIVVPHAGLIYSGWVAAYAFALLKGRPFSTVLMVGPAHYATPYRGFALYAHGAFETPIGRIPVETDAAHALLRYGDEFAHRPDNHRHEHSLEVQLPFLQEMLSDLRITPILMTSQHASKCHRLADAIAAVWNETTLLLASTDLSHHYTKEVAARMDGRVCRLIDAFDLEGLEAALASGDVEMCGGGPALAVMLAARKLGCSKARVLQHADSSDSPDGHGDTSDVVGYLAAAVG